jgi:hypothetical protein
MLLYSGEAPSAELSSQQIEAILPFLNNCDRPRSYLEDAIKLAFRVVRTAKTHKPISKQVRETAHKIELALRVIESSKNNPIPFLYDPLPQYSADAIRQERKKFEELAAALRSRRRRTGGKRNRGRIEAVWQAYFLLRFFGNTPTRTREGEWHTLANILYEDSGADLFQTILVHGPSAVSRRSTARTVGHHAVAGSRTGKT